MMNYGTRYLSQVLPDSASEDHEIFTLKRCLKENMVSEYKNAQCCLLRAKTLYQLICVPKLDNVVFKFVGYKLP